ncbi:HAD superfamily hydrolase [Aeromonas diversa CDC 2478-85]|uniref:HAD superfamily hydrolase n=1 Tax=Aeromonas diversa CDC 2478-85 TaxID=1268237 RepID=N9VJL7_9GAMM|nr:HAD-IA family hydrolase [Aeromonas diversa]ENY71803.1 HAD superfamily hydrolase [Aeromonas diversa CDC 2478-85]
MRFYRRWQPVQAITFDLDDTLYDNGPTMMRAEAWLVEHMRSQYLETAMLDAERWRDIKRSVLAREPELVHDVSLCRRRQLQAGLELGGMAAEAAQREAQKVFTLFTALRSEVEVTEETHVLLSRLAERYPLVAVTNGNLDMEWAGLAGYFRYVHKAGDGRRMKPHPDLFALALGDLGLPASQVLHVGDHPVTDLLGARRHGLRTAWLNDRGLPRPAQLPDVEIAHLSELANLLL